MKAARAARDRFQVGCTGIVAGLTRTGAMRALLRGAPLRALVRGCALFVSIGLGVALLEATLLERLSELRELAPLSVGEPAVYLLALLLLARALVVVMLDKLRHRTTQATTAALRTAAWRHLLGTSPFSRSQTPQSQLIDEVLGDTEVVSSYPFSFLQTVIREPVRLVVMIVALRGAGGPLLACLAAMLGCAWLVTRLLSRALGAAMDRNHARQMELRRQVAGALEHQATWLSAGALEVLVARVLERGRAALLAMADVSGASRRLQVSSRLLYYGTVGAGAWLTHRLLGGRSTPGEVASYALAAAWLQGTVGMLASLRQTTRSLTTALSRLTSLHAIPALDPPAERAVEVASLKVEVLVEGVCFAYPGRGPALGTLSFRWRAGTCLGIAGPSGVGKTTLLRLLARLMLPERGQIHLDGVDLRELSGGSLRHLVGAALQPATLVAGTLRENLALGAQAATDDDLREALRTVGLEALLTSMPEGLDAVVGEPGQLLSAGQLVRIGLARLLVRRPPVVLLDEPTAALDEASASRVVAALDDLRVGRSVCIASHDPRVLALCDEVLTLGEGGRSRTSAYGGRVRKRSTCG